MAPARSEVSSLSARRAVAKVQRYRQRQRAGLAVMKIEIPQYPIVDYLIAIGLYGLLAFAVRVRTKEIGVRLALGASPASVRLMIVRRGVRLAITGMIAGLPFALYAGQLLQASLFDVHATSPTLLAIVSTFVIIVTVAAAYPPARLASRVDPATALRAE